jgi:hypothetical protein
MAMKKIHGDRDIVWRRKINKVRGRKLKEDFTYKGPEVSEGAQLKNTRKEK